MADLSDAQASAKELAQVATTANEVLMEANTVWPFELFTDTITVDRIKVTVTKRSFFNVAKVTSIQYEEIMTVEANSGPILGSISIYNRTFPNRPAITINNIKNNDALAVKRLVQGCMIARKKEIDCSKVDKLQLVNMLNELGREAGGATV